MKNNKAENKAISEFEKGIWLRLALIIIAVILLYPLALILFIIFLINFILSLAQGKPDENLVKFSKTLLDEITKSLNYLLFVSDKKPFFLE